MKSKSVLIFFVSSLAAASLSCSLFSGTGSGTGAGDLGKPLADNLPEETHPGDYITYQGYFFAVLQVRDPASAGGGNMGLELVIGNQSGALSSPFSFSFGGVADESGRVYGQAFENYGSEIRIDPTGLLAHGERARGWLDFSIPAGVRPVSLEMNLINPAGGWITYQYGITPAPDGYVPLQADLAGKSFDSVAFGKKAEQAGCAFKAVRVEDNLESIPNLFFRLPPGARVLGVEVEIGSTGDSTVMIREVSVVDGGGYVYRLEGSGKKMEQGQRSVEAGERLEDELYFVVPSGCTPASIRLICNNLSDPMEDILLRSALG
ncbi:MAG: hypothetical protein JW748_00685 [Anaerolineales bacterium]|nr:hypothetical protein [Anaerolineales bacterium]